MKRLFSLLLVFWIVLLSVSSVSAWYNDTLDNDTCLVIESDKKTYRPNDAGDIFVIYKIKNNCEKAITANIAEYIEGKHAGKIITKQIQQATTTKEIQIKREREKDGEMEVYYTVRKDPIFGTITPTKSLNDIKTFAEKENFLVKDGYQNISLPKGESHLKVTMNVPHEEGEWTITLIDKTDNKIFSILDPDFTGAGTSADPYGIATCADLQDVRSYCLDQSIFFELSNDIDCSEFGNFTPICGVADVNEFEGHFDGQGYTISGVTISVNIDGGGALFQSIGYGGSVIDLGLADFSVTNVSSHAAALTTTCTGCDINNVFVTGSTIVTSGPYFAGGLLTYAKSSGDLAYDSNITNVSVDNTTVTGANADRVGGILGLSEGGGAASPAVMTNMRSSAVITGKDESTRGGIIGLFSSNSVVASSYWDTEVSGEATSGAGTGLTTANSYKQASYDANWDFEGVWVAYEDTNYPRLIIAGGGGGSSSRDMDFNITSLAGNAFVSPMPEFAYAIDGNLTIVWEVFDYNNNRMVFDINYSDENAAGSGTVIVKDLNLDSVVCDSAVFNVAPVSCSWDWNISGVSDGNYMIWISGDADAWHNETAKGSGSDFNIANDVNVIVSVPLNEDTGLAVITSAIGYSLRVSDSTTTTFYDNLTEAQSFTVELGTPTSVTVDVNVASTYYPRIYWLNFSTVQTNYSLQPYLAPQDVSGNYIFYITDSTSLVPLEDVEIVVTSTVPIGGSVEIQDIYTDSAGTATIPLLLNVEYTIVFKYDGVVIKTTTITPTAGSLYYKVSLNITSQTGTGISKGIAQANFYPTVSYLRLRPNGSVDLNFALWVKYANFSQMTVKVLDSNGCVFDTNTFSGVWTDGNFVYLHSDLNNGLATNKYNGLACIFDSRYGLLVSVDVNFTDGNYFSLTSKQYNIIQAYEYNLLYRLQTLLPSELNANGELFATSFLAILVMILCLGSLAAFGVRDPAILGLLGVAILGFFVFLGWFALLPFAFILIATIFSIFIKSVVLT